MPIYLAPVIGSGTKADPYRPAGIDGAGASWSCVDLRADATSVNGYVLLYCDITLADGSLIDLGQNPTDVVPNNVKNQLNNRLGIDISLYNTLFDVIVAVLNSPNLPKQVLRPLRNGKKEIHLGPIHWIES